MSNKPFDRTIIHPLEKPLADDINQLETNFDHALRFFIAALMSDPSTGDSFDGFLGSGLLVYPNSPEGMTAVVGSGLGFQNQVGTEVAIDGVVGLNDLDAYKPLPLLANQSFSVPTAPVAPGTRIDIIEVKADRITTDPSLRQVFDAGLGQFTPGMINKTLAWALDGRSAVVNAPAPSTAPLSYVVGQTGTPGLAPLTSPGYIKIAEIAVGSDVLVITGADITDHRLKLTESIVKVSFPATTGHAHGDGSSAPVQDGTVVTGTANLGRWGISLGNGLHDGDIIEDIVTVVESVSGVSNTITAFAALTEVDVDALTSTFINLGVVNTGAVAPGIYALHHNTASPDFPYTWKAGSSGVITVESVAENNERILGAYAVVRRPILERNA